MTDKLRVERDGSVAILTMDAPECLNAMIPEVRDPMIAALAELEVDATCRSIVIAGAGRAFCSGGDLSDPGPFTPLQVRARLAKPHALIRRIVEHPKPIVAAVDGPAYGAGFSLALACDFVAASDRARFCAAFGKIGVMADLGLLWMLQQRGGVGRMREIVMFCDPISGADAVAEGLADWHSGDRPALDLAMERAHRLAASATAAITLTKSVIARMPLSLPDILAAEREAQAILAASDDQAEGIAAFQEKRAPRFQGQ